MLARTIPTPVIARTTVMIGIGWSPPVKICAAARTAANSTASMRLRVTSSAATVVCALPRRTAHPDPEAVHGDVGRAQPRSDALVGLVDRHDEDAVVRPAQREERTREVRAEDRCDTDERRAPREPAALAQEHRLR